MSTMSGTLSSTRSRLTRMISAPSAMPEASAVSASTTPSSSEIMRVLREIRLRSAASRSDSIPPTRKVEVAHGREMTWTPRRCMVWTCP